MKITILDVETTGIPAKGLTYEQHYMQFPRILSMAWKCVKDGAESETFEYIVNQKGQPIPPEATKINGITDAMCESSQFDIFSVLIQFMMDADQADFIVGHNIYFDTSIIKANVLRIISGGQTPMDMFDKISDILHKDKRIDTMRAGIKLCGKWPKLTELHMKLFQEDFEGAHGSGADVEATYRCAKELARLGLILPALFDKINGLELGPVMVDEEI